MHGALEPVDGTTGNDADTLAPRYRGAMPTDDGSGGDEPLGFNIDIGKILRDATTPRRTTRRRSSTASRSTASSDMDAAVRRAVRAELVDVVRALKLLADEVVRLRRANEALVAQVAKLTKR
jgi:hypothetical protein